MFEGLSKSAPLFKVGDRVRVLHTVNNWRGRIVEWRGPLAPGRTHVYRVRVPNKPKPTYVELPEDFLVLIPPKGEPGDPAPPTADHAPEV